MKARTVVTFRSDAFNTTDVKDYFINPCCFGDDVARWLVEELRRRGGEVDPEPGQEDFGWYLTFRQDGITYHLILGWREGEGSDPGVWVGMVERAGLFPSLRGGVQAEAIRLLHAVLSGSEKAYDLRWHSQRDFDSGEETGAAEPLSP